GFFVLAADGLDHHAVADCLGANLDADDPAVHNRADFLDVRLELARGDAGGLSADPAQVLGLAAVRDLVAEAGFLTGEIADAGHKTTSSVPGKSSGAR